MSGILGRIEMDARPIDKNVFRKANSKIQPYGSDGEDQWYGDCAAFAQQCKHIARRVTSQNSIVELEGLVCVADVILDNRTDLIAALGIDRTFSDSLSDDALILRAYARWGRSCPQHIDGDYAFAIWNIAARTLFLARDHIGTRPLYWRRSGNTLVFATDIHALVQFEDMAWDIDPKAVLQYLDQPLYPMQHGFFHDLEFCPAGGFIFATKAGIDIEKWWDVTKGPKERYKSPEDYAARLRELLERSIAAKIDSDLAIGSHVSGGIDSTAVTCVAQQHLRRQGRCLAQTYSWAPAVSEKYPDMGEKDERRIIVALAKRDEFTVHWGTATGDDMLDLVRRPMQFEGTADLADELPVVQQASEDNIGVMLSGWGGDEAFSSKGIGVIAGLVRRGRWVKAICLIQRISKRKNPNFIAKRLWQLGVRPAFMPTSNKEEYTLSAIDLAHPEIKKGFVRQPLDTRIKNAIGAQEAISNFIEHGAIGMRMVTWAHWSKADFQYRYPLCSKDLMVFMASLPDEVHLSSAQDRYPARTALSDVLINGHQKHDCANEAARAQRREEVKSHLNASIQSMTDSQFLSIPALNSKLEKCTHGENSRYLIDFIEYFCACRVYMGLERY